jgi:hypothetical protein
MNGDVSGVPARARPAAFSDEAFGVAARRAVSEGRWLVVDVTDASKPVAWATLNTTWRDPDVVGWVEANAVAIQVDHSTLTGTLNSACIIKFHASGNRATVAAGQTCTLDLGAPLGPQTIQITTWTLTLAGDRIDCTIAGGARLCTAMGPGVLVRDGTTDGGARDQ